MLCSVVHISFIKSKQNVTRGSFGILVIAVLLGIRQHRGESGKVEAVELHKLVTSHKLVRWRKQPARS